jgi:very-short-patch-repair endonuclease
MGYRDTVWCYTCGECRDRWRYDSEPRKRILRCRSCGAENTVRVLDLVPNLETRLYIGHDWQNQVPLFPVPPENPSEEWAQPYSTRSVLYQLSRELHECRYSPSVRGQTLGETIFHDFCWYDDNDEHPEPCHVMSGFTRGAEGCNLWTKIANLCQTEPERRFLWHYLKLVKNREFPMLIPQARLGIGERPRVDFVVFVPLQRWKYDWLVVELDRSHTQDRADADRNRELEIVAKGYRVFRCVGQGEKGYYTDLCKLVEHIDAGMKRGGSDPWSVAVDLPVIKTEAAPPQPF